MGVVAAVDMAKAALEVAKAALEARHGPPCSIHGLGPFICGPAPTQAVLVLHRLAPASLHTSSKL